MLWRSVPTTRTKRRQGHPPETVQKDVAAAAVSKIPAQTETSWWSWGGGKVGEYGDGRRGFLETVVYLLIVRNIRFPRKTQKMVDYSNSMSSRVTSSFKNNSIESAFF